MLHSGLRVLNADCEFGMVAFALLDVLKVQGREFRYIHTFDDSSDVEALREIASRAKY